jgi:hypothetical protein
MKRRELLDRMGQIARVYGITFDKYHPVHGGNHDKYFVGSLSVEVPRHSEIVEYTARGILRTFEKMCAQARMEER